MKEEFLLYNRIIASDEEENSRKRMVTYYSKEKTFFFFFFFLEGIAPYIHKAINENTVISMQKRACQFV